ncbi:MAG: formate dehydrogenase accessory sulfurtransferase FdhD [Acidobacteriota bacterium]
MNLRSSRSTTPTELVRVAGMASETRDDALATEEPLEIRLLWGEDRKTTVAVTMRTPGADAELSLGFLFAEGVIRSEADVVALSAGDHSAEAETEANVVEVTLAQGLEPDLAPLDRHFFSNSACGVCGKAALEGLALRVERPAGSGPRVDREVIAALPDRLRAAQGLFDATGGLHAAALFDASGQLLSVREDVGRHNALDKLVGASLRAGELPWSDRIVLVSGRSSYEILQKSLAAGVPIVCAVSAPSSLAVELALRFGVTLVGFLRGDRFNVYAGAGRLGLSLGASARLPIVAAG